MNRDEQRWIEMFRDEYRRIMKKLINVNHMSKAAQVSPLPLFSNQQGSESRRFATAHVEVRVGAREALSLAWWRSSVPLCMDSTLCRSLDIWDGEVEGEVPNLSTVQRTVFIQRNAWNLVHGFTSDTCAHSLIHPLVCRRKDCATFVETKR